MPSAASSWRMALLSVRWLLCPGVEVQLAVQLVVDLSERDVLLFAPLEYLVFKQVHLGFFSFLLGLEWV